jgi:ketosteroid isomerase-like protein
MNKTILIIILVVATICVFISCQKDRKAYYYNLQSLIEAERSFAQLSADTGMASAFSYWLANDAIVFRPEPVKGKERYAGSPNVPGMLIWQPEFADVSVAGDLGYTSGPYEFRREGADHPMDGYGHYVSIWQKQADHSWKVLIDVGISHPSPAYQLTDTVLIVTNPKPMNFTRSFGDTSLLRQLDNSFSDSARVAGYRQALEKFATAEVRIYRENYFPFEGVQEVNKETDGILFPQVLQLQAIWDIPMALQAGILKKLNQRRAAI